MASIVTNSSRKRKNFRTPLFILAAVLVVLVVVFLATRKKPAEPDEPEKAVSVSPKTPVVNCAEPENTESTKDVISTKGQDLSSTTNGYVKKAGQMMLPSGKIIKFPPPREDETVKVLANGKIYECDSEGNWKDTTRRKIFHGAFESNLANLAVEGKSFIPAFLVGLDQNAVVEFLKKDYVLQGDETEEELAEINAFVEMKGIALDYIEQGGTFDDFVTEMAAFVQAERKVRASSLKQVMMLYKDGRIEEAREKAAALNAVLTEQGYKPMKLPLKVREAFGEDIDIPADE